MAAFDPIDLEWAGTKFVIPPNRVLEAIARIEEVLTVDELRSYAARRTVPRAKLARAFGSLLRYAGASVTDDDIYLGICSPGSVHDVHAITSSINTLMMLMAPPRKTEAAPEADAGKPEPAQSS